jgi:hypothetical protein
LPYFFFEPSAVLIISSITYTLGTIKKNRQIEKLKNAGEKDIKNEQNNLNPCPGIQSLNYLY